MMKPLYVYVAASCFGCDRAAQIVAQVRAKCPAYPVVLVDLDQPGAAKPAFVFGTPTYVLGERIVSLGNPPLAVLLALLEAELASPKPAAAAGPHPRR